MAKRVKVRSIYTGNIKITDADTAANLVRRKQAEYVKADTADGAHETEISTREPTVPAAPAPKKKKKTAAKAATPVQEPADDETSADVQPDETETAETPSADDKGAPVPNFRTMSWSKLQRVGGDLGVYQSGMSKPELIEALEAHHGVGDVQA